VEGKEEALLEMLPVIEEKEIIKERSEKLKAQKQREDALLTIKNMVKQLYAKSMTVPEIARMLGKPILR
jgi:hypothetical protein